MKNTQKKFLSAVLAASSVAGVVAPAVTAFAATTTEVETLVANALKDKTFYSFNVAYGAIVSLPADQQGKYLAQIAPLEAVVKTADITNILKEIDKFYATEDMSIYDNVLYNLIPKVPAQVDKDYLSYELYKYGKPFIETKQPEYPKATDAIIAIDKAREAGKVDEAQALVAAAEAAVAKVTHTANNTYLSKELTAAKERLDAVAPLKVNSLVAVGAKKLKVTFNKAVADTTKEVLTVKRDNVKLTVTNVEWNAAKTEATLTVSYNLQDGKYSVSSVYDTAAATSVENVEVKASKVSKVSFVTEAAVLTDASGVAESPNTDSKKGVTAKIKVENQYGEDLTDSVNLGDITVTSSKGTAVSLNKGSLKITDTADFEVDKNVVVTIVHRATATVATGTLKVAQSADVANIELSSYTTDDADLKGKELAVGTDHTKFYLPISVKDQYGNDLKAADLSALTIVSSNTSILNPATVVTTVNNKTVIALNAQTGTATNGTAVITVVAPGGKTANLSVTVKENAKIDNLTLEQPEALIKQLDKIAIPFTAFDQYGNALVASKDFGTVTSTGTQLTFSNGATISVTGGTLSTKVDYVNKDKLVLELTPNAVDQVILTVITNTGKVQNVTWSVSGKKVPTTIGSIKSDFYTLIQCGQKQDITGMIKFNDQYGSDISLPTGYSYTIAPVDGTADSITYTAATEEFTAPATKGSEKFKITLTKAVIDSQTGLQVIENGQPKVDKLDEYEFTVEAVELKDITEFGVKDLNKQYTGAVDTTHDQTVKIYGKKNDKLVAVDQALIKSVTVTDGLSVVSGALKATVVDTKNEDKTATLNVLVEGAEAPVSLTKSVVYNSAAPKAATMNIKKGSTTITDAAIALNKTDITDVLTTGAGTFKFELKDQYNVASEDVTFTVTNITDADSNKNLVVGITNPGVGVTTAGVVSIVDGDGTTNGDSFIINAVTSTGLTKTIKVVLND